MANPVIIVDAADIAKQRQGFEALSDALTQLVRQFGPLDKTTVYRLTCPMAFGGKGASWLQTEQGTKNPYFGSAMLKCGSVVETFAVDAEQ